MTDIMTRSQRSKLMSKIRSTNTDIEIKLIKELRVMKLSNFKLHAKLTGKPDIIFPSSKVAVFCDGDFWHGYNFDLWKHKLDPFWLNKISKNIERDKSVRQWLKSKGWKVLRFWGHQINKNPEKCAKKIAKNVVAK